MYSPIQWNDVNYYYKENETRHNYKVVARSYRYLAFWSPLPLSIIIIIISLHKLCAICLYTCLYYSYYIIMWNTTSVRATRVRLMNVIGIQNTEYLIPNNKTTTKWHMKQMYSRQNLLYILSKSFVFVLKSDKRNHKNNNCQRHGGYNVV